MRRSTRITLGIVLFCGILLVTGMVGLVRVAMRGGAARIANNSLLVLHLSGDYADHAPAGDFPFASLGSRKTLPSVRSALEKARADSRIRGVVLDISGLTVGWGAAQELREAIKDFRSSGKQVVAFMEVATDKDYYVAVAADKVYLAPQGTLFLNGLVMEAQFLKDTLRKVGIEADMHHIGEYKSYSETFTRSTMSDAQKEVLNALVDSIYGQLIDAIADGRKLTREEVEAFINDFSPSPSRVVEARLIDGLEYYDQVIDHLKLAGEDKPSLVEYKDYTKVKSRSLGLETGPQVAVLYVSGQIVSGESGRGGLTGGETVGSETIVDAIHDIRDDDDIKAVVLRVDSPGGSALAADIMWRELTLLRQKKPIVVSMGTLAASGGYWIATAGDAIVAQPGTLTGSIGVVFGKFNISGLLDKVGFHVETVSRGKYATMFSPLQSFTPDELNKVDAMLRDTYDMFLDRVAKARNMSPMDVDAVARGRVWTGEQARERKLVDELGGMDEAIALAKQRAKIDDQAQVDLVMYPQEGSFLERLLDQLGASSQVSMRPEVQKALELLSPERSQVEEGPQAILPFIPIVH
jgi:protease-4